MKLSSLIAILGIAGSQSILGMENKEDEFDYINQAILRKFSAGLNSGDPTSQEEPLSGDLNSDDQTEEPLSGDIQLFWKDQYDKKNSGDPTSQEQQLNTKTRKKLTLNSQPFYSDIYNKEQELIQSCTKYELNNTGDAKEKKPDRLIHLKLWKELLSDISPHINENSPEKLLHTYINVLFQVAYLTSATSQDLEIKIDLWEKYIKEHNKHSKNLIEYFSNNLKEHNKQSKNLLKRFSNDLGRAQQSLLNNQNAQRVRDEREQNRIQKKLSSNDRLSQRPDQSQLSASQQFPGKQKFR